MTVVVTAVLPVVIGCAVDVAFCLGFACWLRHCGSSYHATNGTGVLIVHHCVHVHVRVRCGGLYVPHVRFSGLFLHHSVRVFGRCC